MARGRRAVQVAFVVLGSIVPATPTGPAAPANSHCGGGSHVRAPAFLAPAHGVARLLRPQRGRSLRGPQRGRGGLRSPAMGIFDFDVKLRWEQEQPLPPPRELELWLDVRPSAVSTVRDRRLREEGRGDPLSGGWSFPSRSGGSGATGEAAEEAARVMAQLYERMRDAGPLLQKCCPEPPVQGLVFDYRSVPTRGVGDLPLVVSLTDGRMVGVSGETVGRDLRVANPLSMLAEAERYVGQTQHLFIEDVVYGDQAVLRPMLIDEICSRGSNNARGQQTKVLVSVKNIQDLTEGVLLLQHRKEFLKCIGGDRESVEDLRNRGYLSEEDYEEVVRRGWLPPVLTLDMQDPRMIEREAARKADDGVEELRLQREEEEQKQSSSRWVQNSLFPLGSDQTDSDQDLASLQLDGLQADEIKHALVLPPDEELWAAALALRAGDMWTKDPVERFSLLFPKEKGGVPPHVLKHATNAAHQIQRRLDLWEEKFDQAVEQIRKRKSWSSDGKVKGIDLDDSWR